MFIAVALPCSQFLPQQAYVINPSGQALACHHIKLYFSNVQPAPMFGRVMDFQFFGDPALPGLEMPYTERKEYGYSGCP